MVHQGFKRLWFHRNKKTNRQKNTGSSAQLRFFVLHPIPFGGYAVNDNMRSSEFLFPPEKWSSGVPHFDILKLFEFPHCRAHCADSVVVITRRCQRLNPGSSPGRRIIFLLITILQMPILVFSFFLTL